MCPECNSGLYTPIGSTEYKEENNHEELYRCLKCGCEWKWEIQQTRSVVKHGNATKTGGKQ